MTKRTPTALAGSGDAPGLFYPETPTRTQLNALRCIRDHGYLPHRTSGRTNRDLLRLGWIRIEMAIPTLTDEGRTVMERWS